MGEQIRIIRRPEQLSTGRTDSEIRQACASGNWSRIHRGAYVPSDHLSRLDAYGLHRLRVEAVAGTASAHAAVSHISAAVVHGFELWNTPLEVVHLSRDRRGGGRKSARRHVHSVSFTDDEVTHVDGLRVTTPARTVADLARTLPFEPALVVGNSALHRSALTKDAVAASLALSPNHPRHRHALHALTAMDSRIESVGESRSLALFLQEHLPLPEPQVEIHDARGLAGRVDFLWREQRTIGEFDGRIKYGRLVPAGRSAEDVLWNEKLREDRLRDAGWKVARWTWADLSTPSLVAGRILAAFARSRGAVSY
ncbi:hypothetical protein CPI83_22510 [Rhodococcus sp. H-CA8f]|uniref:hypothetical protein n=1 Tax=Rhodococcus TaxID=1827 RepID=UPI000BE43837|nr:MULTISPECIES: hypothetical protein [Rhodococcus]ATI34522.1 hypothetical protein CPI83_22510 [Rhodococcus sp. H-CA8f]MQP30547.1 hypothetical protein [Rhodococcus erythropolis]